jgi:transposase
MRKTKIAEMMDVSEGAVRYHLRREGMTDGRAKARLIEESGLDEAVRFWWKREVEETPGKRPAAVSALWDHLREEHGYAGSYKSVRLYVREKFPRPPVQPYRRIETPPGAQSQSDWLDAWVDVTELGGRTMLHAFVMTLSHSRKAAMVWSQAMDTLCWLTVHNEAYRRLGGVAATNRIDNLKTGISRGAGPWGTINPVYRSYARQMRFHVDAHEPRRPEQKGKVERRVGVLRGLGFERKRFSTFSELQTWTDAQIERVEGRRTCPATGKTVEESWRNELPFMGALPPALPEPFDLVKSCFTGRTATVSFEGRVYGVPFRHAMKTLEIRGCADTVRIVSRTDGETIAIYPRRTEERILLWEQKDDIREGEAGVKAPRPLGRMARRLMELAAIPVERRPIDLNAALAEVAR